MSDQIVIIEERPGREGSLLEFPRAEVISALEQCLAEMFRSEGSQEEEIITRMKASPPGDIRLDFHRWMRLEYAAARLLEQGRGRAYCHPCACWHASSTLRREEYRKSSGPLSGGGGRRFYCRNEHCLLETSDWRG